MNTRTLHTGDLRKGKIPMKLNEWAKKYGITYKTAW